MLDTISDTIHNVFLIIESQAMSLKFDSFQSDWMLAPYCNFFSNVLMTVL